MIRSLSLRDEWHCCILLVRLLCTGLWPEALQALLNLRLQVELVEKITFPFVSMHSCLFFLHSPYLARNL